MPGGNHIVRHAESGELRGIVRARLEEHPRRARVPDEPHEPRPASPAGHLGQPEMHQPQARGPADEAQVAGQCDLGPAADGVAVHRRQHRHGEVLQGDQGVAHRRGHARAVLAPDGVTQGTQVPAAAERPSAGSRDDDGTNRVRGGVGIGGDPGHGLGEDVHRSPVEGVVDLGSVQGENRDAVLATLDDQRAGLGHGALRWAGFEPPTARRR